MRLASGMETGGNGRGSADARGLTMAADFTTAGAITRGEGDGRAVATGVGGRGPQPRHARDTSTILARHQCHHLPTRTHSCSFRCSRSVAPRSRLSTEIAAPCARAPTGV